MIELQSIPKCEKKDSLIIGSYTCINNKPAFRICTHKSCPHPSLCCQDDDCTCNQLHQLCTQIRLKSLLQKLYSKVADSSQIMRKVTDLFDSIIDQVSIIYEQAQKKIKRYGLRHAQIKFLQYLEENRSHTLTGKIVHDANLIAGIKYDGQFSQIQRVVDKLWNQLGGLFWGMLYATKDMYEIPTRVNRLNPDSGEQFFADVIEQAKSILNSLQDMKVQDQREVNKKYISWGETKRSKEQQKVLKKQEQIKRQQFRLEDLGYLDDEINRIEGVQKDQFKVQIRQKSKLSNQIYQRVNDRQEYEKQQPKRRLQNQRQDNFMQNHQEMNEFDQKRNPKGKNQIKQQSKMESKDHIQPIKQHFIVVNQRQPPLIFAQQKSQAKQQLTQNKQVQTEMNGPEKSKVQIQGETVMEPSNQQERKFNQACQYLNDTLGLGLKMCEQFVIKNGYNKEGKLLSMEKILDIALTIGVF